jgi:hypothetical protein
MNKSALILGFSLLATGCIGTGPTFDDRALLGRFGPPMRLEHYECLDAQTFKFADTATFVITDSEELINAIDEIKSADNPELWKGVGWHKLKIYFADTTVTINTNNRKIGLRQTDNYFDLDTENFITKRMSPEL